MPKRATGKYVIVSTVGAELVQAFIPDPLPPNPPIKYDSSLNEALIKASTALGRLDIVSQLIPDNSRFLYSFIRKEAVLSSQIEGTQSSLSDLLIYENDQSPGVPLEDVSEVSNYVRAMDHGMKRLSEGFPISIRLIRELHEILLTSGRGSNKMPGEFRKSQNWVGGTRPGNARFIPPPPAELMACLGLLEKFIHNDPVTTPTIIKASLVHVQFETIHPFLDGNGRVGRLLIPLILHSEGVLSVPLLYISLYIKTHQIEYYRRLQEVRTEGDWEGWLDYFLHGISITADQTVRSIEQLRDMIENHREKIVEFRRRTGSTLKVYDALTKRLILSIKQAEEETGLNFNSVKYALSQLFELGIVREITGHARNRLFAYTDYINLLEQPLEL